MFLFVCAWSDFISLRSLEGALQTPYPPNTITPWRSSARAAIAPVNLSRRQEMSLYTHTYIHTQAHIRGREAIKLTKGGSQEQTGLHKPDELLKNPSWGCLVVWFCMKIDRGFYECYQGQDFVQLLCNVNLLWACKVKECQFHQTARQLTTLLVSNAHVWVKKTKNKKNPADSVCLSLQSCTD